MTQFRLWLAMGGYSFYIWAAYGLAALVLLIDILGIKLQGKRVHRKLKQWFKRQTL
ncbi:MAG: heme exporter protein CcmD [Tatlockia sp.]|nr:heme exporter protein CcmD [Tatlockia sp.]